jgi:hypothetical protein
VPTSHAAGVTDSNRTAAYICSRSVWLLLTALGRAMRRKNSPFGDKSRTDRRSVGRMRVTAKLTVDDAAPCVVVAAIEARIEHVPTVFKRPTDIDDCFERIDIIAIEPMEHTLGVSEAHEIAPEPADGVAVKPGPLWVTKYVGAAPVIDNVRVVDGIVVVVIAVDGSGELIVTVVASTSAAGPSLPTASRTALAASRRMTVPSDAQLTETVKFVPVAALGVKVQPVAVPELEKSAPESPVTDSLNASPNDRERELLGEVGSVHVAVGGVPSVVVVNCHVVFMMIPAKEFPARSTKIPVGGTKSIDTLCSKLVSSNTELVIVTTDPEIDTAAALPRNVSLSVMAL